MNRHRLECKIRAALMLGGDERMPSEKVADVVEGILKMQIEIDARIANAQDCTGEGFVEAGIRDQWHADQFEEELEQERDAIARRNSRRDLET